MNLSRLTAFMLLAVIALSNFAMMRQLPEVQRYHEQIRAASLLIPPSIGPWVGSEIPVPVQATDTLKPNVIISRRYINIETGVVAGLVIIHCSDAHNMVGHAPDRCYPADGWETRKAQPRDWNVDGLVITGTEYEFYKHDLLAGTDQSLAVINCLFRPRGQILRDRIAMSSSIVGAEGQATGAGQLQIYFDVSVPQAVRDAAVKSLVAGMRPLIDAILCDPARLK